MLQQTQVPRVQQRWRWFLGEFPTPAVCAAAGPAAVVKAWTGLGYNRRALALYRAAEQIVERHGGRLPEELSELQALPGVGSYTARAVLAFAFGRDVGVVETNAARVLARAAAGRGLRPAEAQRLADELVPSGEGWAWNQAMLDLGATVCTPRPACDRCPLATYCAWHRAGRPLPDPAVATAGVSRRQSTFSGSDRQGRGRLVRALCAGPLPNDVGLLAATCGWPGDPGRAQHVLNQLMAEGLVVADAGSIRLP
jgi:A/G-specific adenine glycosylase